MLRKNVEVFGIFNKGNFMNKKTKTIIDNRVPGVSYVYLSKNGDFLVESNGHPYEVLPGEAKAFLSGGADRVLKEYGEYCAGKASLAIAVASLKKVKYTVKEIQNIKGEINRR